MQKEWFVSWFDSPYYHILYKSRNEAEARTFIHTLVQFLKITKESKILDLACGKGRHAIVLNDLGMNVLGTDLSGKSIEFAKKREKETLKFVCRDMREAIEGYKCDFVLNLFTSFAYFDSKEDNSKVLSSIYQMLNEGGILVIDFMNVRKEISNLIAFETKKIDGIVFNIERSYDGKSISKRIRFNDDGKDFDFTEKVQALELIDFQGLLVESKFQILRTFGDFELNEFDEVYSERLIIIAQKK